MRHRYIPAIITLAAGAVTSIVNIYYKVDLNTSLKQLLLVLLLFYIIGLIVKAIILNTISLKPKSSQLDEEVKMDELQQENNSSEI